MEVSWVQNQFAGYTRDAEYAFQRLVHGEQDAWLVERSLNLLRSYLSIPEHITLPPESAKIVVQLAWTLHNYLHDRGTWQEISVLWPKLRHIAKEVDSPVYYVELTKQLAITETSRGNLSQGRNLYKELIQAPIFTLLPATLQAGILHQFGVCCVEQGDHKQAHQAFIRCLAIELPIPSDQSLVNNRLTNVENVNIRHPAAAQLWASKAFVINQLGNLALVRGDFNQAQAHYTTSLESMKGHGDEDNFACVNYQGQGRLHLYQRRFDQALPLLRCNLTIRRNRGEENGSALAAIYLAAAYLGKKKFEEAEQLLSSALVTCNKLQAQRGLVLCHLYFGQLELMRGNKRAAMQQWQQALKMMQDLTIPLIQQHVLITYLPWLLWHSEWHVLGQVIHQLIRSARQDNLGILSLGRILSQLGFQW